MISSKNKNHFWSFFLFISPLLILLFLLLQILSVIFFDSRFTVSAQSTCKSNNNNQSIYFIFFFAKFSFFSFFLNLFAFSFIKDLGTIAGENAVSYVGSPIGNLDLWSQISDIQVNPNGTQIIFPDFYANKIRKIDFSTGLFPSH